MPAPTFQNLGFESAGATPGVALGWLLARQASAEEIASYAPSPDRPQEDFERAWFGNDDFLFTFAPTSTEPALYDPGALTKLVEDFNGLWAANESFLFAFVPANLNAASYDVAGTPEPVEDFEELWPNVWMTTV